MKYLLIITLLNQRKNKKLYKITLRKKKKERKRTNSLIKEYHIKSYKKRRKKERMEGERRKEREGRKEEGRRTTLWKGLLMMCLFVCLLEFFLSEGTTHNCSHQVGHHHHLIFKKTFKT